MFTSVITNKGRLLQNKQVDGAKLQFTRVVSSSSVIPIVNLREQTGLTNIKQTLTIQSIVQSTKESCYTMQVLLENTKLSAAYNLSQIGFYASDPDDGEILFAIAQLDAVKRIDSSADMPGYTLEMNFKFQNANNATVTMEFDPEGLMTREGVEVLVNGEEIAGNASGSRITIYDSTDAPLNDIKVFGVSEQEVTNGYQLFDYNAAEFTSLSKGGATVTNNGDGTFTISGSGELTNDISAYHYYTHAQTVKLFKAGKLRFKDVKTTTPRVYIHPQRNGGNLATLSVTTGAEFEITQDMLDDETFKIVIGFYGPAGNTIVGGTIKPMLYQDGDGTFEIFTGGKPAPNPDYPQEVVGTGNDGTLQIKTYHRNFINPAKITLGSNTSFEVSEEGYVITATGSVGYANTKCWLPTALAGHKIIVKYDSAEWTNMGTSNVTAQLIYKTGGVSKYLPFTKTTATELKVTLPEDASDMYVAIYTNNANSGLTTPATIKIKGLMVCLDIPNADTSWCKYQESVSDIELDVPLYGIPVSSGGNYTDKNGQQWICDEIDLARGVHIQRIVKKTYNGDESWSKASSDTGKWGYFISAADGIIGNLLCDRLRNNDGTPRIYMSTTGSGNIVIIVNIEDYMTENTLAAFKEALSTYPINVWYALAEPIETPLTEEEVVILENLRTFEDITSIFVTADIGNLSVNYFKNTNNGKASAIMASKIVDLHSILGEMSGILDEIIGGA